MQLLPKGYYAIQTDFENAPKDQFTYKGVTYAVTEGVNLFATLKDAAPFATETPDTVLDGLDYSEFVAPVVLFSAGRHKVENFNLPASIYLLGEGASVDPNVWGEDPLVAPTLNEARTEEKESVLCGR